LHNTHTLAHANSSFNGNFSVVLALTKDSSRKTAETAGAACPDALIDCHSTSSKH